MAGDLDTVPAPLAGEYPPWGLPTVRAVPLAVVIPQADERDEYVAALFHTGMTRREILAWVNSAANDGTGRPWGMTADEVAASCRRAHAALEPLVSEHMDAVANTGRKLYVLKMLLSGAVQQGETDTALRVLDRIDAQEAKIEAGPGDGAPLLPEPNAE